MLALVDCNNFFVECELTQRPQLRGRAVVVGGNGKQNGCVTAMSNEAKQLGIERGTPVFRLSEMEKLGKVVILPANPALYKRISACVMDTIRRFDLPTEIYSIDEAYIHLPDLSSENMTEMCRYMRNEIKRRAKVPVAIGISTTKTLAKIATRFAKKYKGYDGVCCMETTDKINKGLALCGIGDVWGIGPGIETKLRDMGINTALTFAQLPLEEVMNRFSLPLQCTWHELNGTACMESDMNRSKHLTCRCTRTFERNITDSNTLMRLLAEYCGKVARQLRQYRRLACELEIFIETNRYSTYATQYTGIEHEPIIDPTADTLTLTAAVKRAFERAYIAGYSYKRAGVCATRTVGLDAHTESLFADHADLRRRERLMRTVDSLALEGMHLHTGTAI